MATRGVIEVQTEQGPLLLYHAHDSMPSFMKPVFAKAQELVGGRTSKAAIKSALMRADRQVYGAAHVRKYGAELSVINDGDWKEARPWASYVYTVDARQVPWRIGAHSSLGDRQAMNPDVLRLGAAAIPLGLIAFGIFERSK